MAGPPTTMAAHSCLVITPPPYDRPVRDRARAGARSPDPVLLLYCVGWGVSLGG